MTGVLIAVLYVLQALGYLAIGVGFWMLLRLAGETRDGRQALNRHRQAVAETRRRQAAIPDDYSWTNRKDA